MSQKKQEKQYRYKPKTGIRITDGPYIGRSFEYGGVYKASEIPPRYMADERYFEPVAMGGVLAAENVEKLTVISLDAIIPETAVPELTSEKKAEIWKKNLPESNKIPEQEMTGEKTEKSSKKKK